MGDQLLLLSEEDCRQRIHQQMIGLLAVLSHEFRTPLTIINTATSMLLRKPLSLEERGEMLQMVQQANKRLSTLTDRLMELAQLEAGTFEIQYGIVDILSVIRDVLLYAEQNLAPSLHDCLSFQLQCQDEGGNPTQEAPQVIGDALSLHKVFAHLLENAVRFSPKGGDILVIVRPALPPQTGSQHEEFLNTATFLEICVCDSGLGIESQHLERIFGPFYQVETGLTREVSGLGVGLAICSHLVALHRGRIWAESREGQGSVFHVWLPRAVVGL
jgi:signal transduction histidine kinase